VVVFNPLCPVWFSILLYCIYFCFSVPNKTISKFSKFSYMGVIVQDDLKVSKQCTKAVNTANRILGLISRTLFKFKDTVLQLYESLVRPHLEYCVQCWNPYYRKDIQLIQKAQWRATSTRMIDSLKKYSYHKRLQRLQLTALERRRVRGDLIEVYTIMNGFEDIDYREYFNISSTGLGDMR